MMGHFVYTLGHGVSCHITSSNVPLAILALALALHRYTYFHMYQYLLFSHSSNGYSEQERRSRELCIKYICSYKVINYASSPFAMFATTLLLPTFMKRKPHNYLHTTAEPVHNLPAFAITLYSLSSTPLTALSPLSLYSHVHM